MTQHYLFPEPGSVPGIPGLFSGCRVDVEDDGTFTVSSLPVHPHFAPASVEEEATVPEEEQDQQVSEPTPIRKKQKGGE